MALDWRAIADDLLHPVVVEVLERCERSARSPRQLSDAIGKPLGAVSYHVRQLADKGLLELVETRPRRGALEHFYRTADRARRTRTTASTVQDVGRAA